ncbi:MAG: shikimate dehydrogenase [Candidatus Omnitrophota bacterium]
MITGNVPEKIYGLLGKGISYSLSPAMHNAAFRHFGIRAEYKLFDLEAGGLDGFLSDASSRGVIRGFNVTVPYKVDVFNKLDSHEAWEIDPRMRFLGAVNTVTINDGRMVGTNTDGLGFCFSLVNDVQFDPKGKRVFVCGAGGAGRAICMSLAAMGIEGPEKIYIYDIDRSKLSELERECGSASGNKVCEPVEKKDMEKALEESGLIINATSIGTGKDDDRSPVPIESLKKGKAVYDIVYARETRLIKEAKKQGLKAVNGLGMLVNQAAIAFEIWTHEYREKVKEVMMPAALAELKKKDIE